MGKQKLKKMIITFILLYLGLSIVPVEAAKATMVEQQSVKQENKGFIRVNGKYYYYVHGTPVKRTWKKVNGNKYYFGENARAKVGCIKILGEYYFFKKNSKLYQPKVPTLITYKKNTYYVNKNGRTLHGWYVIKNRLYYFTTATGRMRKDEKLQGITLTKSGEAQNDEVARLKQTTMQILQNITNEKMTKNQKLYECWRYVTCGRFHYASKYPNLSNGEWHYSTALNMLETYSGNCYSFACAFAALAKEAGYDPVVVSGRVPGGRDGAADGYTRHAWVKINNLHYDPEGHYAGWCRGVYGCSSYPFSYQVSQMNSF